MTRELELEVANFVCKFSEDEVLADRLADVVIPAFLSDEQRNIKGTEYFFTDQKIGPLDSRDISSLALTCRFIKNTTLKRHQIFAEGEIVADEQSLASAPSAIAILLLQSHRLLYVKEVPGAPSMQQFGATFKYFMRNVVMAHRDATYSERAESATPLTRKQIADTIPIPSVDVVPVPTSESLKKFINRFKALRFLRVELAEVNNEVDNEAFFEQLRETKAELGSSNTQLLHKNPLGLDKDAVLEHVEAAKQGTSYVTMKGEDVNGDELVGNNTDFSVRVTLGAAGMGLQACIRKAYTQFTSLVERKVLVVGRTSTAVANKVQAAWKAYLELEEDE